MALVCQDNKIVFFYVDIVFCASSVLSDFWVFLKIKRVNLPQLIELIAAIDCVVSILPNACMINPEKATQPRR